MPNVNGIAHSPDAACRKGFCPECGERLEGLNLQAHADHHWTDLDSRNPRNLEAERRRDLLLHGVPATSAVPRITDGAEGA